MAFDITTKRAGETGDIELKDGDGAALYDDTGNPLSVTIWSPASKPWQQANADMNRKRAERMRKNGGKVEAALENARDDQVEFLCRVTTRLNHFTYPVSEGGDPVRALYEDDALGYIRDHVYGEANDWSAFMKRPAKG